MKRKHRATAQNIIKWYLEGSDLSEVEAHTLNDTAVEFGQILENVIQTTWFERALAENLQALDCFEVASV